MAHILDEFWIDNPDDLTVSTEGTVTFNAFYRGHGIRNIGQLVTLRDNDIMGFDLPMSSTLHVGIRNIGEIGLPEDDELLANAKTKIMANFVFHYGDVVIGNPIKLHRSVVPEIKSFLKRNKRIRRVPVGSTFSIAPAIPIVYNYCSIDKSYKYAPGIGVELFRHVNFFNTVITNVVSELASSERTQFIYFDVPDTLPSVNILQTAEREMLMHQGKQIPLSNRNLKIFDSDGLFLLLQLWLWVGENPQLSMFSQIPREHAERVLFLTAVDGRYSVLNLGSFQNWVRRTETPKGALAPERAQRAILRHFMSLLQISSLSDDTIIVDAESAAEVAAAEEAAAKGDVPLADIVSKDSEYTSEKPADAKLDVNIDANDFKKDKKLTVNAAVKKVLRDKVNGDINDAEDFIFDQIDRDLEQLTTTFAQAEADSLADSENVYQEYVPEDGDLTTSIMNSAMDLNKKGLFTAAEVRRATALANRYKTLKSPFDPNQNLEDFIKIDPAEMIITDSKLTDKDIKGVVDKSMMNNSLKNFTSDYIDKYMGKDIANALVHFQKSDIAITDLSITRTDGILGSFNTLSVQLTPLVGKPTTVKMSIPVIDRDGIFMANGVKYRQKIQRVDAPIRKIGSNQVALTSYMSKMFVNRTSRARFNYSAWLVNQINVASIDNSSPITDVKHDNVFDPTIKLPFSYGAIASDISGFNIGGVPFYFDYAKIQSNFPKEVLDAIDTAVHIPLAYKADGTDLKVYVIDQDDIVSLIDIRNSKISKVGKITKLLGFERQSEPVPYADIAVLGNDVPACLILGYHIGLGNLLKTSKVNYRRVKKGADLNLEENEFTVIFEDETLVFSRDDMKACLLFNGFNRLKTNIRRMSVYSFDKPEAYSALLKALKIPLDHLKQYTNIFKVWVDHITHDLLVEMGEPTDMFLLYMSAIDKLCDNSFADPNNVTESILRGYQRISGYIYNAMYKATRAYVKSPQSKNASISINPREVWFSIIQDQTVAPIEESNPIHAIKEKDVVVFRGQMGRDGSTMTAKHRQFTSDSIGILSEANVDNGQVGTIAYLTADPNITSLRGTSKIVEDLDNAPRAKLQSTAMLISPGSDKDD